MPMMLIIHVYFLVLLFIMDIKINVILNVLIRPFSIIIMIILLGFVLINVLHILTIMVIMLLFHVSLGAHLEVMLIRLEECAYLHLTVLILPLLILYQVDVYFNAQKILCTTSQYKPICVDLCVRMVRLHTTKQICV